jgi:hypothetical protein
MVSKIRNLDPKLGPKGFIKTEHTNDLNLTPKMI